jgi:hypothetical protein
MWNLFNPLAHLEMLTKRIRKVGLQEISCKRAIAAVKIFQVLRKSQKQRIANLWDHHESRIVRMLLKMIFMKSLMRRRKEVFQLKIMPLKSKTLLTR